MSRLRILVLASFCDPEAVSMPYVAYCHAAALGELHDVTLVIGAPVEEKVRRANGPFHAIEVVRRPVLERVHAWCFRWIFRNNFSSQALTAFGYPLALHFEWQAWRQLRRRILGGEYDLVLRLLPMSAVIPSPFAFFLRKGPIPFVIGPVTGGLPFVKGFKQAEKQKEWISGLRGLHRFFPFARSTYRNAAAIIAASSQNYAELAAYSDKLFFIPENGVSRQVLSGRQRSGACSEKLELIFVGGLVPCKACDLALRAAAPLLKNSLARLRILGDGPERSGLEELAKSLGILQSAFFHGWIPHDEALRWLQASDVMIFPSVRDFGAGVVFEALATGAVPVVADFGGPGDIVHSDIGYKVPLTNENDVVERMGRILAELAQNRPLLETLRKQGMEYAQKQLTWDAKAHSTTQVLNWVMGRDTRPFLPSPKAADAKRAASEENQSCMQGS